MPVDAMAQIVLAGEGLLTDMHEKLTELTKLEEFTNTKVHQELPSLHPKYVQSSSLLCLSSLVSLCAHLCLGV